MAKNFCYDIFNEKLAEFFKDLTDSFPNVDEFKRLKSGSNMLMNIDPKKPRNLFNTYVVSRYKDSLLKKDETFFLTHNYEVHSDNHEHWDSFIIEVKKIWKSLNNENKEIIWTYFKVLILLSDKCV